MPRFRLGSLRHIMQFLVWSPSSSLVWNKKMEANMILHQQSTEEDEDADDTQSLIMIRSSRSREEEELVECFHDSLAFLQRLQKVIFILGLELGILVQGSTLWIQNVATRFLPSSLMQLYFSLFWSYALALGALLVFFICQRMVRLFLRELFKMYMEINRYNNSKYENAGDMMPSYTDDDEMDDDGDDYECLKGHYDPSIHQKQREEHLLEEWKVEIQCNFVQGAVNGVLLSWMGVDMLINFRTQVIYGGIVLLLSLLIFMGQVWHKQLCLDQSIPHIAEPLPTISCCVV